MRTRLSALCGALLLVGCSAAPVGDTAASAVGDKSAVAAAAETSAASLGLNDLADTYLNTLADPASWGSYNVHDPSILKVGDTYYAYSTDAAYGQRAAPGIQVRKSADLIHWTYLGTALNGLPEQGAAFIRAQGVKPLNGLWAPYVLKVGAEFRLYYSLSSPQPAPRLSVIGLLTSASPEGPWTERGVVTTSLHDGSRATNAIDPSVVVTPTGEHWMVYGSGWDGLYSLQLDPATGLAVTSGDKGRRIARRGSTNGRINGNLEGAEIIYNASLKQYSLFMAYDWLSTKYNVRVGRAASPQGPFLDFKGRDLDEPIDHGPMLIAPYQFTGHAGWQGVSHCAVFSDGRGQFYIAHQGRPVANPRNMVLHVRELFWTEDGWPVAAPERYAGVAQTPVKQSELVGRWDQITLGYTVTPGYAPEQTRPDLQQAAPLRLDADGVIDGDATRRWRYAAPWLTLSDASGAITQVRVQRGRDWENAIASTLTFTGLDRNGTAVWAKQLR